jgi:hypothetical protein
MFGDAIRVITRAPLLKNTPEAYLLNPDVITLVDIQLWRTLIDGADRIHDSSRLRALGMATRLYRGSLSAWHQTPMGHSPPSDTAIEPSSSTSEPKSPRSLRRSPAPRCRRASLPRSQT